MSEIKTHALLSASSASRWLACPPSARWTEGMEESISKEAEEGTLGHKLVYNKLSGEESRQKSPFWSEDLELAVEECIMYVEERSKEVNSRRELEVEVRFEQYVPEGFGRCDCIIEREDELEIIDYKFGKGIAVFAKDNAQLRLYALGALQRYKRDFKKVNMHIVQPRRSTLASVETLTPQELIEWGTGIKPKADKAYIGLGNFASGQHCRYCKGAGICNYRAKTNLQGASMGSVNRLSREEIGQMLIKMQDVVAFEKALRSRAYAELINGNEILGWKLVDSAGKRKWSGNEEALYEMLKDRGIELYETKRTKKALTNVETELKKVVKAKYARELMEEFTKKELGSPKLVRANDEKQKECDFTEEDFE